MKPLTPLAALSAAALLIGCGKSDPAAAPKPVAAPPGVTTSGGSLQAAFTVVGPGGSVGLGDTLEQAKKAFPPPPGAHIVGATNFAIFKRDGWSWATDKPAQAFEVSLKDGKVVGIVQTVSVKDKQEAKVSVDQTTQRAGQPTTKSEGKTVSAYGWAALPNARISMVSENGIFGSGPMLMTVIGDQNDLKMFNFRIDDLATMVKQFDLARETMNGKGSAGAPKKP